MLHKHPGSLSCLLYSVLLNRILAYRIMLQSCRLFTLRGRSQPAFSIYWRCCRTCIGMATKSHSCHAKLFRNLFTQFEKYKVLFWYFPKYLTQNWACVMPRTYEDIQWNCTLTRQTLLNCHTSTWIQLWWGYFITETNSFWSYVLHSMYKFQPRYAWSINWFIQVALSHFRVKMCSKVTRSSSLSMKREIKVCTYEHSICLGHCL